MASPFQGALASVLTSVKQSYSLGSRLVGSNNMLSRTKWKPPFLGELPTPLSFGSSPGKAGSTYSQQEASGAGTGSQLRKEARRERFWIPTRVSAPPRGLTRLGWDFTISDKDCADTRLRNAKSNSLQRTSTPATPQNKAPRSSALRRAGPSSVVPVAVVGAREGRAPQACAAFSSRPLRSPPGPRRHVGLAGVTRPGLPAAREPRTEIRRRKALEAGSAAGREFRWAGARR